MSYTPVSVVIITFNEEKNIARCLESVQGIADEIVVVDSFSRDTTEKICAQYGVKFIQNTFEGHIQQKNFAITQAKYPHILSLDADEALTPELKASILAVKNNWQADGYSFSRLTNYCGSWVRHGGWYPDRKLRLFDSRKGTWKGLDPHDRYELIPGSREAGVKGDLLHYSYYSIKQHLDQINFFTEIGYKALAEKSKRASILTLLYKPFFKFIKSYFLQLGMLDGFAGFCIAVLSAYGVFVKYAKLYLHQQAK